MNRAFTTIQRQVPRKFTPQPPRHINEAKLQTVDRKACSLIWRTKNQIEVLLQDRTTSVSFPINLRRDAGKFLTCARDGGIASLSDSRVPKSELRIGSDKGILYLSLKGEDSTITTGLAPCEAAIATSLVRFAENRRIAASI